MNLISKSESNMAIGIWQMKRGFFSVFNEKFCKINKPRIQGSLRSLRSLMKNSTLTLEFYMAR